MPDPTPDEILERAAEIRSRWTPTQEANRWTGPLPRWGLPMIATSDLSAAFYEEITGESLAAP